MTTFLLIRHAAHSLGGQTIAGRTPGVHLSPRGRQQAQSLAGRLAKVPIRAVYCSPIDRAQETARPIADRLGLPIQTEPVLIEIDFGQWTGRTLDELRPLDLWKQWNAFRSGTRAPGGESMIEVQARVVDAMQRLSDRHPNECVALVSHGDPIKSAVAFYLGVPLDLFLRIEISLASVSVIAIGEYGPWVLGVNNAGEIVLPKD